MSKIEMKPIHTIEVDLGIEDSGPVQQDITNAVYRYMYRYIPFSGASMGEEQRVHLRENYSMTEDSITFKASYAKYQYYGSQNGKEWNYTTPGTGPYWDKVMLANHRKDIINEIKKKYGGK